MRHHLSYADWSSREYALVLRCLLQLNINEGKYPAILSERLAHSYAPSSVYLCNFGHHAIQIALRIFQQRQPGRTEVIVPAYICPSVVQAILACGLEVVSVEVDDDLNLSPSAMQAKFRPSTLAVIAPHMYGCPARIGVIEKLCHSGGIFLIDDAAQVVGVHVEGRLLGSFGDAGIISFGQSKTIVTGTRGSGGVLLINKPEFDAQAKQAWQQLPPAEGRLAALSDFLWNYLWHARTGNSGYYLWRLANLIGWQSNANSIQKKYTKISNLEAGIALIQFDRLDAIRQEKIRITEAYHQALRPYPLIGFPQYAAGRFLARVMLLLPNELDVTRFRSLLKDLGLETRLAYLAYSSPQNYAGKAENLSRRLLGVPCRPGMSDSEIKEICDTIGSALPAMGKTFPNNCSTL